MDHLSDNTTPWQLISSALHGNLSGEEEAAFQQWIDSDAQNRELFIQLKHTWQNDLDELTAYLQADEAIAWDALRDKLVVKPIATGKRRTRLISVVSVAAMLVLVTGVVFWYLKANSGSDYKTGNAEQSVALTDGTLIKLFPASSMEVPEGYNELVRRVVLKNGEAFFEVRHKEKIPFVVDLGVASVKDLGTSFRIKKTNDSIHVAVITGSVELRSNTDNGVHLLKAGMQATLLPAAGSSKSLIVVDSLPEGGENRLRFISTSLPEVIRRFERVYNRQIVITDSTIMQKQFTGDLDKQSFERAMDVLCQSLNLVSVKKNDIYYLKKE